ncbi:ATP-binding protein [Moheibacter sp.]|uniref:ATP-binding protein n=1 Tax=Moheibacter sp. TaxID=1965316 RepID=UPI003C71D42D
MKELLQKDSIFRVGKVVSVEGRTIKVEVDKTKNSAHILYNGDLLRNIAVNSYIKITKGFTKIIGKVEGEFIVEDKQFVDKEYKSEKQKIKRILQISLLGFFGKKDFERGIKELPLINNECFLLDRDEFEAVHDFVKSSDKPLTIGKLTHENIQPIRIGINDLFASHIGIFGNTGSGKSYTLAKIYNELFSELLKYQNFKNNSQFIFIDFNGEYIENKYGKDIIIDEDNKELYELSTGKNPKDQYPISKKSINDLDFWSIILEATEKTQKPFLKRALRKDLDDIDIQNTINEILEEILTKGDKELGVKAITNFLWELKPLISNEDNILELINWVQDNLSTYNGGGFYLRNTDNNVKHEMSNATDVINPMVNGLSFNLDDELSLIRFKIILTYYTEIVRGHSNKEHLSPLMKRLDNRISDIKKVVVVQGEEIDKNIQVISLRDVHISIRKVLPLLICKQLYEEKKSENDKTKSLNIIVDEAHNILSALSQRESETWKDYRLETFEEIIKEGRKFGVFLTIASQRPSDISATIISQLHNFFLHRLINNNDIKAVERTVSYLDKLSFESLPILPTGTCILAGLSAQVPVMVDIGSVPDENEPDNKTIKLTDFWYD